MRLRPRPATAPTLARARELRRDATIAERKAWALLRNRQMEGLKVRRQHAIGRFIVDFYCAELRLVVELDGAVHDGTEGVSYDAARTAWLEAHGFWVLRLRNEEITADGLRQLVRTLAHRSPSPRSGEGVRG